MQGIALQEEGDEQQALEAFETALALVSDRELRLTLLSDSTALLAKQGQWAKVQQRAKEALRLVPNDPAWLSTQQQAQYELAKHAVGETSSSPQAPIKERPTTPSTQKTKGQWLTEGNNLRNLKRHEEALSACDQAIRLDPNYEWAYNNKGNALDDLKRHEEALAAYDQAIRLDSNFATAYSNKGIVLNKLERYEEALAACNQAIRLDPNYALAYNNKGNAIFGLKRYEKAVAAYDQAIRLDPNYALAYNNKGLAFERLGKKEEAQQAYTRARQLGYSD